MSERGEVLVAILKNHFDLALARDQHWNRIPGASLEKWLKDRWPPRWLAFYQTKIFGHKAHAARYFLPNIVENVSRLGGWKKESWGHGRLIEMHWMVCLS